MKIVTKLILLTFVLSLPLSAQQKRMITDMAGRKVAVPAIVRKVYTDRFASLPVFALSPKLLCNSTFEIKKAGQKYISPEYENKPMSEDNDEEILKMKPDVIICSNMTGSNATEEAATMQKRLKIPVLVINFSLPEYGSMFSFLGKALGCNQQAANLIKYLNTYIYPIGQKLKTLPESKRPQVYYAEGMTGENTEPSGSFHSQVIDFVKARNVARTSIGGMHGMSAVSMEQILKWNPEVILVWSGMPAGMGLGNAGTSKNTYDHILTDPVWSKVKAVSHKRVYQIPYLPFGWFDRPPTTNIIPGVLWAAKTLYPGQFSFNMNQAIEEYFSLFYHVKIDDNDVIRLLAK
jgi:iron complex transport system substrate-binding protein